MMNTSPVFRKMVIATCLLAVVVVVLGAFTRLVDAGLGCPDWPGCYGFLTVPQTAEEIVQAEMRFPDSPVEVEKGWPEMVHRYFAGTLGLLIFSLAVMAYRQPRPAPTGLTSALVVLVIFQALLGMWTVTLKLWPQVVSLHLMGGIATLSLLFLLLLRVKLSPWQLPASQLAGWRRLRQLAVIGMVLVACQIFLGGWTSANYAALACPDFPTCQTRWWPPMDFPSGFNLAQDIGPNYLGGVMDNPSRVAIHVTHRLGALVVLAFLLGFVFQVARRAAGTGLVPLAGLVTTLLLIQVALGISNVMFQIPLPIAVLHNAGGAALLLSMILISYRLFTTRPETS